MTLAEVTPQMADLRELAHSLLADSHETAKQRGRSLTVRLRPAA
jgi:FMN-dependent NADH-azoreductase